MVADRVTLARFLGEQRRRHRAEGVDLERLLLDVALACRAVAERVALGALNGTPGRTARIDPHGEVRRKLGMIAHGYVLRWARRGGCLAGMASEAFDQPFAVCPDGSNGQYLLVFDPLDGSSDIDVNVAAGSIFSILRAPVPGVGARTGDFLRPGTEQLCAGYVLYGPATVLVLTLGHGVHGFTLDPAIGEFVLTHEAMRVPGHASELAANASNRRFWEPAVRRYVDECLAGRSGPRHRDFNMRWVASLVAETHRVLTRGGVFLAPRDTTAPAEPGRLKLLFEANPVAFLIEQAGGAASTGRGRVLDLVPSGLRERVPLIFGAKEEVALIDRYHRHHNDRPCDWPLYGERGLFRVAGA
jgi:fructose-1,6-bisphosphatase I/sedoheptulose-1,7-bisphosphatase